MSLLFPPFQMVLCVIKWEIQFHWLNVISIVNGEDDHSCHLINQLNHHLNNRFLSIYVVSIVGVEWVLHLLLLCLLVLLFFMFYKSTFHTFHLNKSITFSIWRQSKFETRPQWSWHTFDMNRFVASFLTLPIRHDSKWHFNVFWWTRRRPPNNFTHLTFNDHLNFVIIVVGGVQAPVDERPP